MVIARELRDRIIAHARREFPNECCGLVGLHDGRAVSVHEAENLAASPLRFELDPRTLLRVTRAIEERGEQLAVYHSHTRSEPYPSQTDVNFAAGWPGSEWLIVGLAGGEPEVRSYRIDDGRIAEVDVEIADG